MSVRFHNVRKLRPYGGEAGPLFDGIDICADAGVRLGILGAAKPDNAALLRLLCGTEFPDGGEIQRTSRVSWPIPLTAFFSAASTVVTNIRFMARLYGVEDEGFPRRVAEMVGIGEFLNIPLNKCPNFVRPRLALGIPLGMAFDIYLFEQSLVPADKDFRAKAKEIVADKTAGRGYVLATTAPGEAEQNCDSVYVLESGRARYFAQAKEGVEYFKDLLKTEKQKQAGLDQADRPAEEDSDADGSGDVDVLGTAIATVLE